MRREKKIFEKHDFGNFYGAVFGHPSSTLLFAFFTLESMQDWGDGKRQKQLTFLKTILCEIHKLRDKFQRLLFAFQPRKTTKTDKIHENDH